MTMHWLSLRPTGIPLSVRLDPRIPFVVVVLLGVTLLTLVLTVAQGDYPISPLDVLQTILGIPTGNPDHAFVVNTLRLPRALVAWTVGMALAVSGAILQGLTRNPLASPGILGINAGASLAAVFLIVVFRSVPLSLLPLAAFGGGMAVATGIYLLSWRQGNAPVRFILVGIALGAIVGSLTTVLIAFGNINSVSAALVWLTGSVYGRSWEHLAALVPWLVIFLPLTMLLARDLNGFNLGDDVARGLGIPLEWRRGILLLSSASLAGAAVATAGTIGFVGLIAPHLARRLVGSVHEGLIPVAALLGELLVLGSDWVGRMAFAPIELPCGLITAIVGAPYFLYLLYRHQAS
jgi:iron complex transport system permease protein